MLLPLQILAAFGIIFLSEAEAQSKPQLKRYNGILLLLLTHNSESLIISPNFTTSNVIPTHSKRQHHDLLHVPFIVDIIEDALDTL